MAAIAAVHAEAPTFEATDWSEIVGLYDSLAQIWPSPVVALNRAVAIGFAQGPAAGLAALDAVASEPVLAGYSYLAASRTKQRPHRTGPDLSPRVGCVIETPQYGLTIFKVHFVALTLKGYTKDKHVLRFEAVCHNTNALHVGPVLDRFADIVSTLATMLERFCTTLVQRR